MTPKLLAKKYRHGPSDAEWKILGPAMFDIQGPKARKAGDDENRIFLHALFWIATTNLPWRNLPPDFGKWRSVHDRFMAWSKTGRLTQLFQAIDELSEPGPASVDSTTVKAAPCVAGARKKSAPRSLLNRDKNSVARVLSH